MVKLTAKQEAFAVAYILNGCDATSAYKEVYDVSPDAKIEGIYVAAHRVLKNTKVSLRVHELQMMEYSDHVLTIEERKRMLTDKAKDGLNNEGLKAVDMLNRMDGVYEHNNEADTDDSGLTEEEISRQMAALLPK